MSLKEDTKRGDTIIEVMFAIVIFCFVVVLSISSMNSGIARGEGALELVTARNELNAQAEALRFVHSSYISEKTLPLPSNLTSTQIKNGEKYQQYQALWEAIVSNAVKPADAKEAGLLDLAETVNNSDTTGQSSTVGCARVYETGSEGTLLAKSNAFVLNTRDLNGLDEDGNTDINISYVSARTQPEKFAEAPLGARIIFGSGAPNDETDSTTQFTDGGTIYNRVAIAEGIWVIAVTDGEESPKYYDFYIESCWFSPDTTSPTVLDTVIRLYNPENIR